MLTYRQYGEKERNIMAINYDSYLGFETTRHTTEYFVNAKIEMLYDLCILTRRYNGKVTDALETPLRRILTACKTEQAMTDCLHDVIFNDKSIAKLVAKKWGACK